MIAWRWTSSISTTSAFLCSPFFMASWVTTSRVINSCLSASRVSGVSGRPWAVRSFMMASRRAWGMVTPFTLATAVPWPHAGATGASAARNRMTANVLIDISYFLSGDLLGFPGSASLDRKRVDFPAHQRAQRVVDHAVPRLHGLAGEAARDDGQAIVPAAALRALVAGVPARFVLDLEGFRVQLRQPLLDELGGAHSAFLSSM